LVFEQSAFAEQFLPVAHARQVPPQSTSVSAPFIAPSLQVGTVPESGVVTGGGSPQPARTNEKTLATTRSD